MEPHFFQRRQKNLLHMVGRGSEVLKESTRYPKRGQLRCESSYREERKCQHGGGPRRPDIPVVFSAPDHSSWTK